MIFKCTYCQRERKITLLEFKQNSTCNLCFNERSDEFVKKNKINTSEFYYHNILIENVSVA